MRLALAALLALQPVVQAAELAPVDILLTRAIPQDEVALAFAGPEKGERLAILQSDLAIVVEGLEGFANEADAAPSLKRLQESVDAPQQFKDRAAALDAAYRALAVVDYTWAKRLPDAPCSPDASRASLLKSGALSSWISSLLGVEGDAATALDRASASTKASTREYALLRAKIRRLSEALGSEKAVGAMRASLYCRRAEAYEALSAANRSSGLTAASRATGDEEVAGVYVLARPGADGWEILGAATSIEGAIITDARLADSEGLALLGRDGKPIPVTVERRDSGLALLRASEPVKGLVLAEAAPAKDDLIEALGHPERTGVWTRTRGLVTSADDLSFQSDAVVDVGMAGGAALTEDGKLAGVFVLRRARAGAEAFDWPVGVSAPALKSWLAGGTLTAPSGSVEVAEAGTASILTASRPLGVSPPARVAATQAGHHVFYQDGIRAVCMANCDDPAPAPAPRARSRTRYTNPRSSYSSGSNANAELGKALGEAIAPLVEAMIFKGIPALFRGIGSLFKSKPKSQTRQPSTLQAAKPPEPPKIECNLEKSTWPEKAGADPFDVAVRFSCTGEKVDLAGHNVTFTFEWDGKTSSETISIPTGPGGAAALTIQVANQDIAVHKVRAIADRSFDELDKYSLEMSAPEELPESLASASIEERGPGAIEAASAIPSNQEPAAALTTGVVATTASRTVILSGKGKVLRVIITLAPKALGPLVVVVTVKQVLDIGWSIGTVANEKINEIDHGLRQYDKSNEKRRDTDGRHNHVTIHVQKNGESGALSRIASSDEVNVTVATAMGMLKQVELDANQRLRNQPRNLKDFDSAVLKMGRTIKNYQGDGRSSFKENFGEGRSYRLDMEITGKYPF